MAVTDCVCVCVCVCHGWCGGGAHDDPGGVTTSFGARWVLGALVVVSGAGCDGGARVSLLTSTPMRRCGSMFRALREWICLKMKEMSRPRSRETIGRVWRPFCMHGVMSYTKPSTMAHASSIDACCATSSAVKHLRFSISLTFSRLWGREVSCFKLKSVFVSSYFFPSGEHLITLVLCLMQTLHTQRTK